MVFLKCIDGLNLVFQSVYFCWLCFFVYKQYSQPSKVTWFTAGMIALLAVYALGCFLASAILLKGFSQKHIDTYPSAPNFAQRLSIDNCAMGMRIWSQANMFFLWTAAVLLGIKFKMTAQKIHSAVCAYGSLYAVSVLFFTFEIVVICKTLQGEWRRAPEIAGAAVGFLLLTALFLSYYFSLSQMKHALEQTLSNQVNMTRQKVFLGLLALVLILQVPLLLIGLDATPFVVLSAIGTFSRWIVSVILASSLV
jgi:hypothetical protein